MKRAAALAATTFVALTPALPAAAETFQIDPAHSRVGFAVKHMVVATVRGEFEDFEGSVDVDLDELTNSSVKVTIDAGSVDTGEADRDEHLRSADFFDVENHPQLTFETIAIEREGDDLVAVGDLTIRGIAKRVRMPIDVAGPIQDPWGNTRLGVSARLAIDRTDFGLNYNRALETGGLVVGQEVEIEIDVELIKRGG